MGQIQMGHRRKVEGIWRRLGEDTEGNGLDFGGNGEVEEVLRGHEGSKGRLLPYLQHQGVRPSAEPPAGCGAMG